MEPTELEIQFSQEYSAHFPVSGGTPSLEESRAWVDAWWADHPHDPADAPTMGPAA
jgi:hypothetical protein